MLKGKDITYSALYSSFAEYCNRFDETGFSKKDFITLSKTMVDIDFSNTLDSVSCPVLILCGEKDKANRKASEKLSGILKDNSFEIIENASHEVNIDNPEKQAKIKMPILSGPQDRRCP